MKSARNLVLLESLVQTVLMSVTVTMVRLSYCCQITCIISVQEPHVTQWMESASASLGMPVTGVKITVRKDILEKIATKHVNVNQIITSVIQQEAAFANRDMEVTFSNLSDLIFKFIFNSGNNCSTPISSIQVWPYTEPSLDNSGHSGIIFVAIFTIVFIVITVFLVVFLRRRFKRLKSELAHVHYIANSETGTFSIAFKV